MSIGDTCEGWPLIPKSMQILPEEVCKQTLDDWRDSAAEYVRAELFDKKQFITDEEIGIRGSIQK